MNKELNLRYDRIEKELKKYLLETDSSKESKKFKANVCEIGIIDLQNIVAKINTNSLSLNDMFFKSIKPIVKTALTSVSLWNYLLETEVRTIETIRDFEDEIKNIVSDSEDYKFIIKSILTNLIYIFLFLIKNRTGVKVTDLLSITTNILDTLAVINDLADNCPLVKDSINTIFGDFVSTDDISDATDELSSIVALKTANTTDLTTNWSTSYVDNVISAYKRVDTRTLDYNLDSYLDKLIDFLDKTIFNFLPNILKFVDFEIDLLNSKITDSADVLVDFIMGLGFGEMMISKAKLDTCIQVIIKHDKKNKKEYETYYERLKRIPKALGVFSVNDSSYILNPVKLKMLLMKYYFAKKEEDSYNELSDMISNLDCVIDDNADKLTGTRKDLISKKDQNSIRSFTFFAIYYYGAGHIINFLQELVDGSSIKNNVDFTNYVENKINEKTTEINNEYYDSIQNIDNSILNSIEEIVSANLELSDSDKESLFINAKNDLKSDYEKLENEYNEKLDSLSTNIYNYYINNPNEIEDPLLRLEVSKNKIIIDKYSYMKTDLYNYYFGLDKNLGTIVELLGRKDYRNMIDSITTKGTDVKLNKEVVTFINDQMIYDLYGDENVVLFEQMGLESKLFDFINNIDFAGKTPSLYYMIDRFSKSMSLNSKSYNSRTNLKQKLQSLLDTYFSSWKHYDTEDIISDYYDVLKDLNNDEVAFIDYNGVKPLLDLLNEIASDSIDDFKDAFGSEQFTFKNSVYNVDTVDKMNRSANNIIEGYFAGDYKY